MAEIGEQHHETLFVGAVEDVLGRQNDGNVELGLGGGQALGEKGRGAGQHLFAGADSGDFAANQGGDGFAVGESGAHGGEGQRVLADLFLAPLEQLLLDNQGLLGQRRVGRFGHQNGSGRPHVLPAQDQRPHQAQHPVDLSRHQLF